MILLWLRFPQTHANNTNSYGQVRLCDMSDDTSGSRSAAVVSKCDVVEEAILGAGRVYR